VIVGWARSHVIFARFRADAVIMPATPPVVAPRAQ
jgi:hypothetical protein